MTTEPQFFEARDGVRLAWREMGEGRPVVLLHGLFSNAEVNWIKFGTAERIAREGFRVIMPDLRVHGSSDAPHEPEQYPADVLVRDLEDLVAQLNLSDFDLGGFSLGARTSTRAVVAGMRPRRLILGGMGLAGLAGWAKRGQFFQRVIADYETAKRGDDTWLSIQFMKTMKVDRIAAGQSPAAGREVLDESTRQLEAVLLGTRLRDGFPVDSLATAGRRAVAGLMADELVDARAALAGRIELTLRGRLLADAVVRRLTVG